MKKLLIVSLLLAVGPFTRADDTTNTPGAGAPAASWKALDQQAQNFAAAVQSKDPHALHKIDHAVPAETAELQKATSSLPADQKQKFDALLADLAKQAERAHHASHAANWDDVAAAQKQFTDDLKQAEALLPLAN